MSNHKRAQKPAAAPPQAEEAPPHENPLLPHAKLRQIYLTMLQCEHWERRTAPSERTMRGLEAVLSTLVIDLLPTDRIGPCSLENELRIVRGFQESARTEQELAIRKSAHGSIASPRNTRAKRPSRLLPESAQWGFSTGLALAQKLSGDGGAAVLLSRCPGNGTEGCHQALTFAAANQLPMLYAIWREAGAARASACAAIVRHAHTCGIPVITVDGTDAVGTYRVVQECLQRARNGDGPTLIECVASPGGKTAPSAGPLSQMEHYLTSKRLFTKEWKREQVALLATPRTQPHPSQQRRLRATNS